MKLTKENLKKKIIELEDEIVDLEEELDSLRDELDFVYDDLNKSEKNEQKLELELQKYKSHGIDWIKDLDNFIYRLKMDNLYSEELEKFIQDYMQFYNEGGRNNE